MSRDELVEKMWSAFRDAATMSSVEAMAAALSVAVEELLSRVTPDEGKLLWERFLNMEVNACYDRDSMLFALTSDFMAGRRLRYLKPKSAEERVTRIVEQHMSHENARKVACQIIAELKEQSNGN